MRTRPNETTARDAGPALEDFAAELTRAAYAVALRHGVGDKWLDLELDLWLALTETVRQCGRGLPRAGCPGDARPPLSQ
jgi:hypothetical protein